MLDSEMAQQLLLFRLLSEDERMEPLSSREVEVIVLCARGLTNSEIAQVLSIPVNKVRMSIKSILRKLRAMDQVENAMWEVFDQFPAEAKYPA
jgi:DNA-binding NarL/FixJ family response regulator